jgi:hypothetical protein
MAMARKLEQAYFVCIKLLGKNQGAHFGAFEDLFSL